MFKRFCKRMKSPKYRAWLMRRVSIVMVALLFVVAILSICTIGQAAQCSMPEETTAAATYSTEPEKAATKPTEAAQPEETTAATTEPEITETPVTLYNVPLDEELQLFIIERAEMNGIDPAIIFAMAYRESTYDASAIGDGGNSYGLLQIQPRWHKWRMEQYGCDNLLDPYQNVIVGIDYLAELLDRYDGDIAKALVGYNQGSYNGTVTKYANAVMEAAEELRGDTYERS